LPSVSAIPKTTVVVTADYKVSQATIKAIDKLNEELKEHGIELETDMSFYTVRLPKKNGKPKLDMPCFDPNYKIVDVKIDTLSVQIKKKEAIKLLKDKHQELTPQTEITESDLRDKGVEINSPKFKTSETPTKVD
jgi:hypothetical protein